MSHTSANMEIKTSSLQKLFSMHTPSCFGTAHADNEESPPRTPTPRSHTLSLHRSSPTEVPTLSWRPRDGYMDFKTLQHGFEAKSHATRSIRTGRVYVVKRFKMYRVLNIACAPQPGEQPLPNEAFVLLKALKPHPNILEAFGCGLFGKRLSNLYTTYCTGGDLMSQMLHFRKINRTPP